MLSKPCRPTNSTWITKSRSPRPLCSSGTPSTAFGMAITSCPCSWTRCTQKCIIWTAFGSGAGRAGPAAAALVYRQCPYCTNDFYLQSSTLIKSDLWIGAAHCQVFSTSRFFLLSFWFLGLWNCLMVWVSWGFFGCLFFFFFFGWKHLNIFCAWCPLERRVPGDRCTNH